MQDSRRGGSLYGSAVAIPPDPPADQRTVLLVDPDEDSQNINAALLRHCGYRVLQARNGVEGILLARKERPDLIVTELFVPSARGWKVPELLRRDHRTAQIPILALTAYAFTTDEERAWSAGCDGFLSKPCEPSRVMQEVRRLLTRSNKSR